MPAKLAGPSCGAVSQRIHSRYRRRASDLPLVGRNVQLLVILVTYAALRFAQHKALDRKIAEDLPTQPLSVGGKCVALGIGLTPAALLVASAFDRQLGLPTFVAGTAVTVVVLLISR